MLKHLLATTAIVAVSATAMAAEQKPMADQKPAAAHETMYLDSATITEDAAAGDHLASYLIGENVYSSDADDAEIIGDINDLVVSDDGSVEAVVIGVGGFLGVGEKNVAVSFDDIDWSVDENGTHYAVLPVTQDELENAPSFDTAVFWPDTVANQVATTDQPMTDEQTADDQMAASDQPATDDQMTKDKTADDQMASTDQQMTDDRMAPKMRDVASDAVSANELIDTTVYGADDANVGEVGDVLLTDNGGIDAIIIDVGGFLGIGEKPVAIAFEDLMLRKDENDTLYVYTTFTEDQLEAAPQYDANAYNSQRDAMRLSTHG